MWDVRLLRLWPTLVDIPAHQGYTHTMTTTTAPALSTFSNLMSGAYLNESPLAFGLFISQPAIDASDWSVSPAEFLSVEQDEINDGVAYWCGVISGYVKQYVEDSQQSSHYIDAMTAHYVGPRAAKIVAGRMDFDLFRECKHYAGMSDHEIGCALERRGFLLASALIRRLAASQKKVDYGIEL